MAKTAHVGKAETQSSTRGDETRRQLIEAAIGTLKDHGFAGASARVIADRAGVNQGLVFYHFDSVVGLLLAALDAVSATRQARYGEAVAGVTSPAELVEVASSIYREDLDAGHVAVLVAMIAGAASTPGLGEEVAKRIEPWVGFARDAIAGVLADSPLGSIVPADDLGFAVVALYLGMEMLTQLDGNRAPATALFDRAMSLATLLGALGGTAPGDVSRVTEEVPTS
jgi:AcrR family transcriptional regulator